MDPDQSQTLNDYALRVGRYVRVAYIRISNDELNQIENTSSLASIGRLPVSILERLLMDNNVSCLAKIETLFINVTTESTGLTDPMLFSVHPWDKTGQCTLYEMGHTSVVFKPKRHEFYIDQRYSSFADVVDKVKWLICAVSLAIKYYCLAECGFRHRTLSKLSEAKSLQELVDMATLSFNTVYKNKCCNFDALYLQHKRLKVSISHANLHETKVSIFTKVHSGLVYSVLNSKKRNLESPYHVFKAYRAVHEYDISKVVSFCVETVPVYTTQNSDASIATMIYYFLVMYILMYRPHFTVAINSKLTTVFRSTCTDQDWLLLRKLTDNTCLYEDMPYSMYPDSLLKFVKNYNRTGFYTNIPFESLDVYTRMMSLNSLHIHNDSLNPRDDFSLIPLCVNQFLDSTLAPLYDERHRGIKIIVLDSDASEECIRKHNHLVKLDTTSAVARYWKSRWSIQTKRAQLLDKVEKSVLQIQRVGRFLRDSPNAVRMLRKQFDNISLDNRSTIAYKRILSLQSNNIKSSMISGDIVVIIMTHLSSLGIPKPIVNLVLTFAKQFLSQNQPYHARELVHLINNTVEACSSKIVDGESRFHMFFNKKVSSVKCTECNLDVCISPKKWNNQLDTYASTIIKEAGESLISACASFTLDTVNTHIDSVLTKGVKTPSFDIFARYFPNIVTEIQRYSPAYQHSLPTYLISGTVMALQSQATLGYPQTDAIYRSSIADTCATYVHSNTFGDTDIAIKVCSNIFAYMKMTPEEDLFKEDIVISANLFIDRMKPHSISANLTRMVQDDIPKADPETIKKYMDQINRIKQTHLYKDGSVKKIHESFKNVPVLRIDHNMVSNYNDRGNYMFIDPTHARHILNDTSVCNASYLMLEQIDPRYTPISMMTYHVYSPYLRSLLNTLVGGTDTRDVCVCPCYTSISIRCTNSQKRRILSKPLQISSYIIPSPPNHSHAHYSLHFNNIMYAPN